jgi:hypothetical protein
MTKEKGGEHSDGKIIEFMREHGRTVSNMESEFSHLKTELSRKVNGKMAKKFAG